MACEVSVSEGGTSSFDVPQNRVVSARGENIPL